MAPLECSRCHKNLGSGGVRVLPHESAHDANTDDQKSDREFGNADSFALKAGGERVAHSGKALPIGTAPLADDSLTHWLLHFHDVDGLTTH